MNRSIVRSWPCFLVIACVRPPSNVVEGGAALAAAETLARARECAGALELLEPDQAAAVEQALEIAPVRLAPVRGHAEELAVVRVEVEDRLEVVRASAGAARAIARREADDPTLPRGRANERLREGVRATDALCRAASAVESVRLARHDAGR